MKTLFLSLAILLATCATYAQKKNHLVHHAPTVGKGKHPWQYRHTNGAAVQKTPMAQFRTDGSKVTLDSAVAAGERKSVFSYDANGYVSLETDYNWDIATHQWVLASQTQSSFDANGNQTLDAIYDWNATNNQWVGSYKKTDAYDANGNDTLSTIYNSWDNATSQFVPTMKIEYAFDAKGKQTLLADYNWNATTGQWIGEDKHISTFDANGNQIFNAYYNWDATTSQFVLGFSESNTFDAYGNDAMTINTNNATYGISIDTSYYVNTLNANHKATTSIQYTKSNPLYIAQTKTVNSYDANGNDTLSIIYTGTGAVIQINNLNSDSSNWQPIDKTEFGLNTSSKLSFRADYGWDASTNQWVGYNEGKEELAYDANGNLTLDASYNWDSSASQWVEVYKDEATFDAYGDRTFFAYYSFNDTTQQWVGNIQTYYSFDTAIPASSLASPFYYTGSQVMKKVTSVVTYDTWSNGSWGTPISYLLYYSDGVTGITQNQVVGSTTLLYPNPCKDVLNVQGGASAYEVYTVSGTVVGSNTAQTQTVDTSQLPAGVYFLKLSTATNSSMLKFVKE